MAQPRHLDNAPITEAIIDLRVKGADGFNVEKFLDLKTQLAPEYPRIEPRTLVEGGFEITLGKAVEVTKKEELLGYWFKSSDGLNIAQFRTDGFTFNRLKPYSSWDEVFPEAWRLWQIYTRTGAAEVVTRIATRFINRLNFPSPVNDLGTYLTAPPRPPEGVSGNTAGFLTRILLDIREGGFAANITQALEKGVDPNSVVIILDIDVYKRKQFKIASDDSAVIATFASLRDLKNRIFFSSITEEAARLFE